jgi:hypothetical protein
LVITHGTNSLHPTPARNMYRKEGEITIPAAERIKFLENEE